MRKIRGGLLCIAISLELLWAGTAWAGGPPFDPKSARGGIPQCKADLATCNNDLAACLAEPDAFFLATGQTTAFKADKNDGIATPAHRTQWNSTGPKTWANESFLITTSEAVGYCVKKDGACWYAADNRELDRNEQRRVVVVDHAYLEKQLPTVKKRLTQAGVRLGHLLNQALGGSTNGYPIPTFSITNLVARIRETGAIGFFTKLALKNQIDDLLSEFREFHEGASNTVLSVLKDRFNFLLMKVITLLQDDDSKLFQDIVSARELLWINLADPEQFERL